MPIGFVVVGEGCEGTASIIKSSCLAALVVHGVHVVVTSHRRCIDWLRGCWRGVCGHRSVFDSLYVGRMRKERPNGCSLCERVRSAFMFTLTHLIPLFMGD